MNNKPDFRTEFIRFFKSRGYPASGIFYNAKIGNTHVEYLITVPNSTEKLAIMTAQGIDDNPTQIRKPFEYCLQEMGNPDYSLCLLTPSDEVNSQYSFSLYHLDKNGLFTGALLNCVSNSAVEESNRFDKANVFAESGKFEQAIKRRTLLLGKQP